MQAGHATKTYCSSFSMWKPQAWRLSTLFLRAQRYHYVSLIAITTNSLKDLGLNFLFLIRYYKSPSPSLLKHYSIYFPDLLNSLSNTNIVSLKLI